MTRRFSLIEIEAQVVVFDLDDTLYLEKDFAESGFSALARQFGERVGGMRFAAECRKRLAAGIRGKILDLALSASGIEPTPELIAELVAYYRAHQPEIEFCTDASRLFARISDMRTGLITDGHEKAQYAKINALGLDRMIDHIVVTGDWAKEFSKPHPRAFELIETLTSCTGRAIVYVADNAAKDFVSPRRLGWQSVQILRPSRIHDGAPRQPDHKADHVITSFDELTITLGN